jgi:hypothetical protein
MKYLLIALAIPLIPIVGFVAFVLGFQTIKILKEY